MQGASPLASPGMNPGGTGRPCRTGTPAGGLSGWLPARPATAVPNGSSCRLCRLLTLPSLSFLPPSPPPPFPTGRGRPKLFYARGFAPCIPRAEPGRHWLSLPYTCPRGGRAFFAAYLRCLLFLFCPPSPKGKDIPPPPSRREGGDHKLVLPGASPLASPGLNPGGAGRPRRTRAPVEGVLSLSPAYTAFSIFSAPIPPPPSQREGGDHKLVLPGATAPGTPALNCLRRLQSQRNRHSGGRRIPETALTVSAASGRVFPRK